MPNERLAAERLAVYAAIETDQARDARKIAEALFKPKAPTKIEEHLIEPATENPITVTRTPRILNVEKPLIQSIAQPAGNGTQTFAGSGQASND